jgi:hypothetical protein
MDMTPNPNHQARLEFAQRQLAAVEGFFPDVGQHPLMGPLMKHRREYFSKMVAEAEAGIRRNKDSAGCWSGDAGGSSRGAVTATVTPPTAGPA